MVYFRRKNVSFERGDAEKTGTGNISPGSFPEEPGTGYAFESALIFFFCILVWRSR